MAENKLKYIIDASVALKWAMVEGEDLEKALLLKTLIKKRLIDALVPSLFFYEILNSLGRKKPELALVFFSQIKMTRILECRLTTAEILTAIQLMKKYPKTSFYDTAYHALAIHEGGTFITSDEKYYETTKKRGNIVLLKKFAF